MQVFSHIVFKCFVHKCYEEFMKAPHRYGRPSIDKFIDIIYMIKRYLNRIRYNKPSTAAYMLQGNVGRV